MCEIAVKERDKFSWNGTRKRVSGRSLKRAEKDDRATVERQLHLLRRAGSGDDSAS